jgi:hypothetical protein
LLVRKPDEAGFEKGAVPLEKGTLAGLLGAGGSLKVAVVVVAPAGSTTWVLRPVRELIPPAAEVGVAVCDGWSQSLYLSLFKPYLHSDLLTTVTVSFSVTVTVAWPAQLPLPLSPTAPLLDPDTAEVAGRILTVWVAVEVREIVVVVACC